MPTRLSRLLVEARLYLYLLGGTLILQPWLPLLAAALCSGLVAARWAGFAHTEAVAGLLVVLVLASPLWLPPRTIILRVARPDPGVREPLELHPTLKQVAEQTARELGSKTPTHVLFRLSPLFRHWGAPDDPDDRELGSGTLRVDLSRAGICSIFEFRCDLAKAILQPRMARWLSRRVLAQVDVLAARMERGHSGGFSARRWNWLSQLREAELNALRAWRLFAEIETDRALATQFGKRCVASWIEKSWFSEWVFPVYQQVWLEPAWQRGYLPPTMDGFRRYHEETGGEWLVDTDANRPVNMESRYELSEIARWQPHRMRLLALESAEEVTASVYDTRPASVLLADGGAEERVIRRAMVIGPEEMLEPISWDDYPEKVILAEIDDMIHEEGELFEGKTLEDLPAITEEGSHMVYEMVHMPFLPPQFEDRLAAMPNALAGFLIKNLLARGWELLFDLVKGVTLRHPSGSRTIDPMDVVHGLADGAVSEAEFAATVLSPAGSVSPAPGSRLPEDREGPAIR
jgi:hypothetical protein